jgi:hypothetical protein
MSYSLYIVRCADGTLYAGIAVGVARDARPACRCGPDQFRGPVLASNRSGDNVATIAFA